MMKIVLSLALLGSASAACPNGCSGHGTCGAMIVSPIQRAERGWTLERLSLSRPVISLVDSSRPRPLLRSQRARVTRTG